MRTPSLLLRAVPCLAAILALAPLPAAAKGRTLQVGVGQQYTTIAAAAEAAKPGDTVLIAPGVYRESVRWRGGDANAEPITVRAAQPEQPPVIDGTGIKLTGSGPVARALFQIEGDNFVFERLDFRNARNGSNASGIRFVKGRKHVVRHCRVTQCDMGIMSSHDTDDLLVERSEIAWNGTPQFNGFAHNFYLDGKRALVRYCYIHDATSGQNFKTRGRYVELLYNHIADSHDSFDGGTPTKEVGLQTGRDTNQPNSHAVLIGNVIVKRGTGHGFIDFGPEGSAPPRQGTLYMAHNTVLREAKDGKFIFRLGNSVDQAELYSNIFYGTGTVARGPGAANIRGSRNWFPQGSDVPPGLTDTIFGSDPGFMDLARRDYRLRPTSECLDRGITDRTHLDANGRPQPLRADREYQEHFQDAARPDDGKPDLGAYELAAADRQGPLSKLSLSGRLTDAAGRPLARHPVVLNGTLHKSTLTDQDGRYNFWGLRPGGSYAVFPWSHNVAFRPARRDFPNLQSSQGADFAGPAMARIRGMVTNREGKPLGGIAVYVEGEESRWMVTKGDGAYDAGLLPAGKPYLVRVFKSVYAFDPPQQTIELADADAQLTFAGAGQFIVGGHIGDEGGQPLAGVSVQLTGDSTTLTAKTNARGNYTFSNIPEGRDYKVSPSQPGYVFSPAEQELRALDYNQKKVHFTGRQQ